MQRQSYGGVYIMALKIPRHETIKIRFRNNLVFGVSTCCSLSMVLILNEVLITQPYWDVYKIFLVFNKESKFN